LIALLTCRVPDLQSYVLAVDLDFFVGKVRTYRGFEVVGEFRMLKHLNQ
jgi:hypothetical protein